ncbi:hypothetical protein [Motiliproteus sp. SC1-56]|uniref:hypothetical protein n=1 Tax=Motiliproteus sp. SC1-56 TaxID=2799565 RepID=UPI001A8F50C1|nr:hypothetical protein [Motiliproteus sp. SC1-56]
MKPDPRTAMALLLEEVRNTFPFDIPPARLCDGPCSGCPKKLLEYLDTQLEEWEDRLKHGEAPRLGDLDRLGRTARKVHRVLEKNGLLGPA